MPTPISVLGKHYRPVSDEEYAQIRLQIARGITEIRTGSIRGGVAYLDCTVCGKAIKDDPRGDVLDSSGRCFDCTP